MTIPVPRLERSLVTRTAVGLRPFRPAGFRVDGEWLDGRMVIHNYGHGGSGVTLAPGTAMLAAELAAAAPQREAAVIGAGVVGLCTARELQRQGVDVALYTAARTPATTSNAAGAIWGTFTLLGPDGATPANGARIAQVARASHAYYAALDPGRYGIRAIALYLVGAEPELPWELGLTPELFPVERIEPSAHPFAAPGVLRTSAMMFEPDRLLAALEADVIAAGGRILERRFATRDDVLALREPVIVNCSGTGARVLFGDTSVEPVKGELALLERQPGIDYAVISLDDDAYILPRENALVVGGSRVPGDVTLEPREGAIDRILERARALYR